MRIPIKGSVQENRHGRSKELSMSVFCRIRKTMRQGMVLIKFCSAPGLRFLLPGGKEIGNGLNDLLFDIDIKCQLAHKGK